MTPADRIDDARTAVGNHVTCTSMRPTRRGLAGGTELLVGDLH